MTINAFAKVNLFLDVVGKRNDGFHNVRSVMHTVSLSDELDLTVSPSDVTNISFSANVASIDNRDNLVFLAIEKYLAKGGIVASVEAKLQKKIPIGGGLGGGSADAAAALRFLNARFSCFSDEEMLSLAAELGSDVPFLYLGGTAFCEGRGERMRPIEGDVNLNFVIAIGNERISTPWAYKELDGIFSDFDGSVESDNLDEFPKIDLGGKGSFDTIPLYNVFEKVVSDGFGGVFELKNRLTSLGARYALMSGSGPAVFGIFDDAEAAKKAEFELKKDGILAFYAHSVEY